MRLEFILLALAFVYLIYKLAIHYYSKQHIHEFMSLEDKEENLDSYLGELHQLCGKHINTENKLDQLEAILEAVRSIGFEILRLITIDRTNVVLFTRVAEGTSITDSIVNYEMDIENDYLVTFDMDKAELKIISTFFTSLDDKITKNDFARVFIDCYKKV